MTLRRFREWLRVISPVDYLTLAIVAVAALAYAVGIAEELLGARRPWEAAMACLELLIITAIAAYVAIRVLYFHPVLNLDYGKWLATTPWRYPQQLPLGPLGLVWQDAFFIAVFTALKTVSYFPLVTVPVVFLTLYCLAHAAFLCCIRIYWAAYMCLFLLGCIVLAIPFAWAMLPLAGLMYAAVYVGQRQLLSRFPFEPVERSVFLSPLLLTSEKERWQPLALVAGWPAAPKSVERRSWRISQLDSALLGLTTGWLFFCADHHFQSTTGFDDGMHDQLQGFVGVLVLLRVVVYTLGFVPPISVLGRIATRRLIIPGYDVVFAAPLAVVVLAWLMNFAMDRLGTATIVAVPTIAGISTWLMLALPPRREDWQLMGHHRIAYRFRAALMEPSGSRQRK